MASEHKLGDKALTGAVSNVKNELQRMERHFTFVCAWIMKNCQRSDQNVTFFNLISSSTQYLRLAADNIDGHVSALAMATRSLYEINLRTRAISTSKDNMRIWHSEAVTDKIQALEGLLELDTAHGMDEQRAILRAEIDRLDILRDKYNLPDLKQPIGAGNIAKDVGQEKEHKALFKLFSKLVHPSSYLINDYCNAASDEVKAILHIHAQLYAWDTFSRVCDATSVPSSIREIPIGKNEGNV